MTKNYFIFLIQFFLLLEIANAKAVECRAITGETSSCTPYSKKLLKAKEIKYNLDRKKLIVTKTLPLPEKKSSLKVISVEDLIEKYVKIEESIRFTGTEIAPEVETKKQKIYTTREKMMLKRKELFDAMKKFKEEKEKKRREALQLAQEEEQKALLEEEKRRVAALELEEEKKRKAFQAEERKRLKALRVAEVKRQKALAKEDRKRIEALKLTAEEERKALIEQEKKRIEALRLAVEKKKKEQKERLEALKLAEEKKQKTLEEKRKNQGMYAIQKGDTLSTIAAKFSMQTKVLIHLNKLEKKATLKIGKKLVIPCNQKKVDSIANAEYVVVKGDNLASIARDFNLTVTQIIKFNRFKKGAIIRLGQKIPLPLPYVQKKKKYVEKKKRKLANSRKTKGKSKFIRNFGKRKLRVTATAYSSHKGQTDSTPFLAAWNNRLRPGMKSIAVSRDMLTRYGMKNGTKVRIAGLPGYYRVRDKMNKRYKKRIDIYMGLNRRKALRWGRRSVVIHW